MDLAWGKCTLFTSKLTNGTEGTWKKWPIPVDGSTQLTTTKGEKKEAKVEGGENEAVKYNKNTYAVTANIRKGNEDGTARVMPVEDVDGIVEGEYAFKLMPENPEVEGVYIKRVVISAEDQFTAADGAIKAYTFDALKPKAEGEKTINWQKITDPTDAVKSSGS